MALGPGMGGQVPPRADQVYRPGQGGAVAPGTTNVIRARQVIVSGTGEGVFVYSGTPALGNSPVAWLSSGGRDPFGNVLPSASGIAGSGTFEAGNTVTTTAGTFYYSPTIEAGNLILSNAAIAGTDSLGNHYVQGTAFYSSGSATALQNAGIYNYGGSQATGWTLASALGINENDGAPFAQDLAGMGGIIPITQTDMTTHTTGTTGQVNITNNWPIPANDAFPTTTYELECGGSGSVGSLADSLAVQFNMFGLTLGPTAIAAGTIAVAAFHWHARGKLVIGGTGPSVPYSFTGELVISWGATPATCMALALATSAGAGADTTSAHGASFSAAFPVNTTSPSITCTESTLTRAGA